MPTSTSLLPGIDSPRVVRTAVLSALALAEHWDLSRQELARLLGVRSPNTLDNWRRRVPATLSPDTLERVSYLLHIYRSLAQLFGMEHTRDWLRSPSDGEPFLGTTPLDYMLQGQMRHLLDTHRYLKGFASGAF